MIYGLTTAMVCMAALPGGSIADQFLGLRKAVLLGQVLIPLETFFCDPLNGIVLHRPGLDYGRDRTVKTQRQRNCRLLYSVHDSRRDDSFSIFYMGIITGALLAPLLCGSITQYKWRYGSASLA